MWTVAAAIIVAGVATVLCSPCHAFITRSGGCPGMVATSPAASADTIRGDEAGRIWTKGELKQVLTEQAGRGPEGEVQRSRNARVAMLCTLLFPGLGQMYNERPFKAIIAMGVESFYLSQILLNHRYSRRAERRRDGLPVGSSEWSRQGWWVEEYKERRLDWIWWSAGVVVVLMLDSYIDAHLFDMNVDVEGVSLEGGGGVQLVFGF